MVTAQDAKLASWICTGLAIVILMLRLAVCRYRDKWLDITTFICIASIAILAARVVVVYLSLTHGTANDALDGSADYFNHENLMALKLGSICAVMARLLITTFSWLQICLLLIFYSRIMAQFGWVAKFIKVCWATIFATYVATILTTCLECRPFRLYWQVIPPPGSCVHSYIQLFMQGISNVVLDLMLLVIAFPVLKMKTRTAADAIRIGILFGLGFFCIIVSCLRVAYIYMEESLQPVRSFWAAIQMIVSTFVANAPSIYGRLKLLKRRRTETRTRRASQAQTWGGQDTTVESQEPASDSTVPKPETSSSAQVP